jgi:aminopeptidase
MVLALGASIPETGDNNQSALHWDMVCGLRNGSEILVDGELYSQNGRFMICRHVKRKVSSSS